MRKAFCVGDSIRWGYEPTVIQALAGEVDVAAMGETQGGDTRNILRHLDEWVTGKGYDVIHLNAGLHDMIRAPGPGPTRQVPIEEYRKNLDEIFTRLRQTEKGKLIFGLSTPCNLQWQLNMQYPCNRTNEDIEAYNVAAREVAARHGVVVNDLYSLVMRHGMESMHDTDGVHYTPAGSEILGKQVAQHIREALK